MHSGSLSSDRLLWAAVRWAQVKLSRKHSFLYSTHYLAYLNRSRKHAKWRDAFFKITALVRTWFFTVTRVSRVQNCDWDKSLIRWILQYNNINIKLDVLFELIIFSVYCYKFQMFTLGIPPKLAAVWFGSDEVSTACAAGVFGNQVWSNFIIETIIYCAFLICGE